MSRSLLASPQVEASRLLGFGAAYIVLCLACVSCDDVPALLRRRPGGAAKRLAFLPCPFQLRAFNQHGSFHLGDGGKHGPYQFAGWGCKVKLAKLENNDLNLSGGQCPHIVGVPAKAV
jgi:hypothetical protein